MLITKMTVAAGLVCRAAASSNIDRFYTPRRYRFALCKTVKLIQTLDLKTKK
ncbi:hypothetical protein BMS3Abin15_00018 [bacterium BMS3Abin15]|nr:hypothetical protein BMS3Abin15_00018 [bacterium BMS3Abin15]